MRPMVSSDGTSRRRTNELLSDLRRREWTFGGWWDFTRQAAALSWKAAVARPRAATELTVLHIAFLCAASGRGRVRVIVCWGLSVTHLGLLEERDRLCAADALTLLRANLPAVADGAWTGPLALATDLFDGRLARRRGLSSSFGAYADALADAAFWIPFALRHETDPRWRAALVATWVLPVAGAAAASFARGRMVDVPRARGFHPATVVESAIAARALTRDRATGGMRDRTTTDTMTAQGTSVRSRTSCSRLGAPLRPPGLA
ncbi:CDP-alcohol phosphatidyltransferase family protein [Nocardiopsis sp. NRRL B-16309]|uniref:CDP-alcohol phosphatidyltransferase family protein n=1 Tax=Nocardiopsis sp. NRRL B-16309 TaxID=1519494 RepID=UPI000ACB0023|nr:CDP-alcohol phosphatidyltransferase family protein [Nocardiopsis sp. NRRL B-16309]